MLGVTKLGLKLFLKVPRNLSTEGRQPFFVQLEFGHFVHGECVLCHPVRQEAFESKTALDEFADRELADLEVVVDGDHVVITGEHFLFYAESVLA
jgi:hypothetical protein